MLYVEARDLLGGIVAPLRGVGHGLVCLSMFSVYLGSLLLCRVYYSVWLLYVFV